MFRADGTRRFLAKSGRLDLISQRSTWFGLAQFFQEIGQVLSNEGLGIHFACAFPSNDTYSPFFVGDPMATRTAKDSQKSTQQETVQLLQKAYRMELETVINYLANSNWLDGMLAEEVKRALASDVSEELGHAQKLAGRLKQLKGRIPGSLELKFDQESLRPPQQTTDVKAVIGGVIDAETSAIEHYRKIFSHADANDDPVTADMATQILADEEAHLTLFQGFQAALEC
jgi:bacterioferritin